MERNYDIDDLQDAISELLQNKDFVWENRAGNSGWSYIFNVKGKTIYNVNTFKDEDTFNKIIYTISYNHEINILKVSELDHRRWIPWEDKYRGFCDSLEEFFEIIKRLNIEVLTNKILE